MARRVGKLPSDLETFILSVANSVFSCSFPPAPPSLFAGLDREDGLR
jgi:hypothetical protein